MTFILDFRLFASIMLSPFFLFVLPLVSSSLLPSLTLSLSSSRPPLLFVSPSLPPGHSPCAATTYHHVCFNHLWLQATTLVETLHWMSPPVRWFAVMSLETSMSRDTMAPGITNLLLQGTATTVVYGSSQTSVNALMVSTKYFGGK